MESRNVNTIEPPNDAENLKIIRRRNQNRIAQMLHRKRKDQIIESLQARLSLSEQANEQHLLHRRTLNKRVQELERDNAEMRAFIASLGGSPSIDHPALAAGQLARPALLGSCRSVPMLRQWETEVQPSAISDLGYPGAISLYGDDLSQIGGSQWSGMPFSPGRVQGNRRNFETTTVSKGNDPFVSLQANSAGAVGILSMSNDVDSTQTPPGLPGGSDSISLAQAAIIIQRALADTLDHTCDTYPHDERPRDLPASDPSTLEGVYPQIDLKVPSVAPSTFDVVRLIRDDHFDFVNDLSCPIFQTIVLASTGQGHVTVPVLGEDGNALTSSELWDHLRGSCKVSRARVSLTQARSGIIGSSSQFEDSLDLHLLCDGLRKQIAGRQTSDIHIKDIDDLVYQLWFARHIDGSPA